MNFLLIFHHFGSGLVPGEMHLVAEQEPVAVGSCDNMIDNDTITGTHRSHYFAIAKGIPDGLARCDLPTGHASGPQSQQQTHQVPPGFKTPNEAFRQLAGIAAEKILGYALIT